MVYKIRIILDTKDNIFRDVEIKAKQTLWNLQLAIKSAFSLQGEELSAFNLLQNDGTVIKSVPLEDMSDNGDGEIMSDIYIDKAFENVGDKAQFQYGLLDLWEFYCELIEIIDEKPSVNYPITVYRFGNVPLKIPSKNKASEKFSPILPRDMDFNNDLLNSFEFGDGFEHQNDQDFVDNGGKNDEGHFFKMMEKKNKSS